MSQRLRGKVKQVSLMKAGKTKQKQETFVAAVDVRQGSRGVESGNAVVQKSPWLNRALCLLFASLVITIAVLPKPVLVKYTVGGNVLTSVYWQGFDGEKSGRLLDADYTAYLSEGRKELTLCTRYSHHAQHNNGACVSYRYEKTQGVIPALFHIATHPVL